MTGKGLMKGVGLGCLGLFGFLFVLGFVGSKLIDDSPERASGSLPPKNDELPRVEETAVEETTPPAEPKGTGRWLTSSSKSAFDDSPTEVLSLAANSSVKGWPAVTYTPRLVLRCQENQTEVYVEIGMQPQPDYPESGINGSFVRLRFDDRGARRVEASKSTDGKGLFLPNSVSTIREMLRSERMLFGFTPFNSDPQTTEFDLGGLEAVIEPLQRACGWQTVPAVERSANAADTVLRRFEQTRLFKDFALAKSGGLDRFEGEVAQKYAVGSLPDAQIEVWFNESRITSIAILGSGNQDIEAAVAEARAQIIGR